MNGKKRIPIIIDRYARYILFALLCGFIAASGLTLYIAVKTGSNIFFIQSAPEINLPLLAIFTAVFSVMLFFLFKLRHRIYYCALPLSVFFFAMCCLCKVRSLYPYFAVVMAILVIAFTLCFKDIFSYKWEILDKLKGRGLYIAVLIETLIVVFFVSFGTIIRYYTFNSSTFDFGLFVQMFESMATDFTQNTTLERGEVLSHFAVHFSPIYYVLLPFYMIFRNPESLLAMQAAVCFSGVIPLLLLCKKWRYSPTLTLAITTVFLCVPAFTGGCFYDFHENCFLVPIILWLLYFLQDNKAFGIVISAFLLLCVKEDAGLYLIFIGLYALFNKKITKVNSICLTVIGVFGFFAVTKYINLYGEGIKVSRYDIYLTAGQDSLTDVVLNVIKNPAFFFSKLLNEGKLLFLMQMLLPLMFIPFRTRKLSDWLLTAPFILINLATDYSYQYDIGFQYVFGTAAILIFLFAKNIRYSKHKQQTAAACIMAALIILCAHSGTKYRYFDDYNKNPKYYSEALELLKSLPRDKVIYAGTYLTPALADCPQVYQYPPVYEHEDTPAADYILIDTRGGATEKLQEETDKVEAMGYRQVENETFILVYVKE